MAEVQIEIIFKIAGVGLIVAVLNQILIKSGKDDQAIMTTIAGLIVVIMMLAKELGTMFDLLKSTFGF